MDEFTSVSYCPVVKCVLISILIIVIIIIIIIIDIVIIFILLLLLLLFYNYFFILFFYCGGPCTLHTHTDTLEELQLIVRAFANIRPLVFFGSELRFMPTSPQQHDLVLACLPTPPPAYTSAAPGLPRVPSLTRRPSLTRAQSKNGDNGTVTAPAVQAALAAFKSLGIDNSFSAQQALFPVIEQTAVFGKVTFQCIVGGETVGVLRVAPDVDDHTLAAYGPEDIVALPYVPNDLQV